MQCHQTNPKTQQPSNLESSADHEPLKPSAKPPAVMDYAAVDPVKFWQRVNKKSPEECWEWQGTINGDGYGVLKFRKAPHTAHRISLFLSGRNTSPEKPMVLHSCHNRRCVNPNHLRPGCSQENEDDKVKASRQCRGSAIAHSKLSEAQVSEIRALLTRKLSKQSIANRFCVARQTISKISRGLTWKHHTL